VNVLRIANEPTAAAITYSLSEGTSNVPLLDRPPIFKVEATTSDALVVLTTFLSSLAGFPKESPRTCSWRLRQIVD
jgi:hypothetical protein